MKDTPKLSRAALNKELDECITLQLQMDKELTDKKNKFKSMIEAELKARLAKVTKIQITVEPISRKEVERLLKNRMTESELHKQGIF